MIRVIAVCAFAVIEASHGNKLAVGGTCVVVLAYVAVGIWRLLECEYVGPGSQAWRDRLKS